MDLNGKDLESLCRICAASNSPEKKHFLIADSKISEIGKVFESCVGIQVKRKGFSKWICNYCHLQLEMFAGFIKRAKEMHESFENISKEMSKSKKSQTIRSVVKIDPKIDELVDAEIEEEDFEGFSDYDGTLKIESAQTYTNDFVDEVAVDEEEWINDADYLVESTNCGDDDMEFEIEYLEQDELSEIQENDENESITSDDNTNGFRKKAKSERKSYPYRCNLCKKRYVYKEVLEAHLRQHQGLPGYQCPNCPKTFNEKVNFDYHMQDHTNYRPAKCTMCDKSFKNKQDLASHIRVHKDIRRYECNVCGKRFRSQSHMVYHRYSHFDERNFHCDMCTQSFKSPHILRTHRNTVHSTVYPYECNECGRKFKRDHHLTSHKKIHLKSKLKSEKKLSKVIAEK